jgi:hypothetical protein
MFDLVVYVFSCSGWKPWTDTSAIPAVPLTESVRAGAAHSASTAEEDDHGDAFWATPQDPSGCNKPQLIMSELWNTDAMSELKWRCVIFQASICVPASISVWFYDVKIMSSYSFDEISFDVIMIRNCTAYLQAWIGRASLLWTRSFCSSW